MHVSKTKFERNSSLECHQMTCIGKTKHTTWPREVVRMHIWLYLTQYINKNLYLHTVQNTFHKVFHKVHVIYISAPIALQFIRSLTEFEVLKYKLSIFKLLNRFCSIKPPDRVYSGLSNRQTVLRNNWNCFAEFFLNCFFLGGGGWGRGAATLQVLVIYFLHCFIVLCIKVWWYKAMSFFGIGVSTDAPPYVRCASWI